MNSKPSRHLSAVPQTYQKPFVYGCLHCGHFAELLMSEDVPQGSFFTCSACLAGVQVYDLDIGSPGLTIQWRARPASFKRQQFNNLLRVWWQGRITTLQLVQGFVSPATAIWFADHTARGMVCVCPEILARISEMNR
jgi:hypothetical protein